MEKGYEGIGPTAWGVAYRRTFSDISYSLEIFNELQRIMKKPQLTADLEEEKASSHDLQFEARFKLVNRLLKENRADQVLEIASGFSPRGIQMAQDPSIEYIELDLPGLIKGKKDIVQKLIQKSKIPSRLNLHFEEGNALEMQDLERAVLSFKDKPIAVINEGLLRYLNFQEQTLIAQNIHKLLKRFGGVWITPDISVQRKNPFGQSGEKAKEQNLQMQRVTGVDVSENRFESEEAACMFFENLGFGIERHGFMRAADELVLPQKLSLSAEQVAERIGRSTAFVMRLRQ